MAKLSISIADDLAAQVRTRAGPRGVSTFAADAMRRELVRQKERERLGRLLDDLAAEIGPPDEDVIAEVDALWPDF